MVNRGDYVASEQQNYKVIAALGSAIYLQPISNNEIDKNTQQHNYADIEQQYRKIEYVLNKE
ncbi:MAG: hypothetical protein Q4C77_07605 [Eubacteriales bacterium]|nr:hypothetical protein [Eubacteriales bacterium]